MDLLNEYTRILKNHDHIALGTSVNNEPNVRVLNYHEDTNKPGVIYFLTDPTSPKVNEFEKNNMVAFSTLIKGNYEFVRVQKATVRLLESSEIEKVKSFFLKRDANIEEKLKMGADIIAIYALEFNEASIKRNTVEPFDKIRFNNK